MLLHPRVSFSSFYFIRAPLPLACPTVAIAAITVVVAVIAPAARALLGVALVEMNLFRRRRRHQEG
jgi:hypothetical protein